MIEVRVREQARALAARRRRPTKQIPTEALFCRTCCRVRTRWWPLRRDGRWSGRSPARWGGTWPVAKRSTCRGTRKRSNSRIRWKCRQNNDGTRAVALRTGCGIEGRRRRVGVNEDDSNSSCADNIVGHWSQRKTNERQQDRGEHIVPAGTSHFVGAEYDRRDQKFERDPWNVQHRWRNARLHSFDDDVAKALALELKLKLVNLSESIDHPTIAKLPIDLFLKAAQLAWAQKAVDDHDAAARTQQTAGFPKDRGFIRSPRIATAFQRIDGIERLRSLCSAFIVAEKQLDAFAHGASLVEEAALLKLPGNERDPNQLSRWKPASKAAQRSAKPATHVQNASGCGC